MAQSISPDLQQAVISRFTHGYSRRDIVAELQAAGYETATATEVVDQIEASQVNALPTVEVVTSAPVGTADSAPATGSMVRSVAIGGVAVLALAGAVYAGYMGVNSLRGTVWSAAPYADGSELLAGLLAPGDSITAGFFASSFGFETGPRQPETAVLSLSDISSLDLSSNDLAELPPEATMEAAVSGVFDISTPERPQLDITSTFTMELDPIFLSMAGSLRSVDSTLYGRIDKLPTMFAAEIDPIPVEEWLILHQGELGPETLQELPFVLQQQPQFGVIERLQSLMSDFEPVLAVAKQALAASPSAAPLQLANSLAASGLYVSETDRQLAELRDQIIALLKLYPPIRVVGTPSQVTEQSQQVFRYEVAFEYENIRKLLVEFARTQNLSQREIDRALADFPSEADFDRVNRLLRMTLNVTPKGALAGVGMTVAFAIPERPEQEVSVKLAANWVARPDGITVTAPSPVHPKTLEQIMLAEQQAQEQEWFVYRMESLQSSAEYERLRNGSYKGLCESVRLRAEYCVASDTAYIVAQPMPHSSDYYCINSTGFAGQVTRPPVLQTFRCQ